MKASSLDLRERVLRAVDQGYPRAEIVQLIGEGSRSAGGGRGDRFSDSI
jgi:hypothetical protein